MTYDISFELNRLKYTHIVHIVQSTYTDVNTDREADMHNIPVDKLHDSKYKHKNGFD